MDRFTATVLALMRRAAALPIVAANPQASQRIAAATTEVSRLHQIGVDDPRLLVQLVDGKLREVQDAVAMAKSSAR
ncbi:MULTISPECIES: hypothetical protein [Mycobacterium]|uniref:Uncharacterized protein n=1 Tax=Mycobacterium kyorinense TaxID=487514 RepID=A0A1X1YIW4_9MYCO|nr:MULTISPECIES: hypothetical protein [Mycobacterium]ORW11042.1 hypothetical protein AWC14_19175 [Mycobacterium kyorinense]